MARALARQHGLGWLSLDDIAWRVEKGQPVRRSTEACGRAMEAFMSGQAEWVMDGCYGDLIRLGLPHCSELRFLNPGVEACVAHCRSRAWEPEKYPSQEEQDAMLDLLIDWVRDYAVRDDDCSLRQHRAIFDSFEGGKREYGSVSEYAF